jgi:hypothetical protein
VQVINRSNAKKALEPAWKREGAMPRKGEARNVRSQVVWAVCDSQTNTCNRGRITEKPCAAKVACTVLKQRWRERSLHRL